jgi:hypothetical protein
LPTRLTQFDKCAVRARIKEDALPSNGAARLVAQKYLQKIRTNFPGLEQTIRVDGVVACANAWKFKAVTIFEQGAW